MESSASEPLSHVLDLVCELAIKKPWLRQECGWVLYSCLLTLPPSTKWVAESILVSLLSHNLCQTPEGVAAWLAVKQRFSDVKFPLDVWKHDNPLYKKDKSLLAKAMRDATPKHEDDDNAKHAQGGAVWKAQLHFAWETVLGSLYSNTDESGQLRDPKLISFEHFWTEAVDGKLLHCVRSGNASGMSANVIRIFVRSIKQFRAEAHRILSLPCRTQLRSIAIAPNDIKRQRYENAH